MLLYKASIYDYLRNYILSFVIYAEYNLCFVIIKDTAAEI